MRQMTRHRIPHSRPTLGREEERAAVRALRSGMVDELSTTAAIVGDNSGAALAFDDPASARQTLRSLNVHPHIVGAALWTQLGYQFPFLFGTSFVLLSLWYTQKIDVASQRVPEPQPVGLATAPAGDG